jgi:hypothetical protein
MTTTTHDHIASDDSMTDAILARLEDLELPEDPEDARQFDELDRPAVLRHIAGRSDEKAHAELERRLLDILRAADVAEEEWSKADAASVGGEAEKAARVHSAQSRRQAYGLLLAGFERACAGRCTGG